MVTLSILSFVVWTGRWYFEDISAFAERFGGLALFAMAWGLWPALGAVLLYRTVTYTYRITDRALLVDFGSLSRPVPAIPWSEIQEVTAGGSWLSRVMGVGWVEVQTHDHTVRMCGVRHPGAFADAIRSAVRAGTVTD